MESFIGSSELSHILVTFFSAMLPITELRGSIPVAITVFDLHPAVAYTASLLGNLVPMFLILYFFESVQRFLSERSSYARRFFQWLYARTRYKLEDRYKKYGALALCFFVAIPLPMTGVVTGSIAAWLFAIPKSRAIFSITLGAIIAGLIMIALTLGAVFIV